MENDEKGEIIRTEYTANESDIKARGVKQCEKHVWKKLNDIELACIHCPTVIIVNPEAIESLCAQ